MTLKPLLNRRTWVARFGNGPNENKPSLPAALRKKTGQPDTRTPVAFNCLRTSGGEYCRPPVGDLSGSNAEACYSGFSVDAGSSGDDGLDVSSDVSAGLSNILRRLALRDLAAPTGAGTARNSARSNFGLMENMVIKDAFHGRRLSRL